MREYFAAASSHDASIAALVVEALNAALHRQVEEVKNGIRPSSCQPRRDWSSQRVRGAKEMARTSDADTSFSTILSQLSQPAGVAHLSQPLKIPQTFLRRSKSVRDVDWVFKSVFKRQKYKGMQREVMQASLNGVDIVVIAPTGMGKSLCFQVPAIAEEHGMTIVVSPLLCTYAAPFPSLHPPTLPAILLPRGIEVGITPPHPKSIV